MTLDGITNLLGKPARENHLEVLNRLHLPPKGAPNPLSFPSGQPSPGPLITIYQHAVCDSDSACGRLIRAQANALQLTAPSLNNSAPAVLLPRIDDEVYARNSACAWCESEESAEREDLKRCGGCKLPRCEYSLISLLVFLFQTSRLNLSCGVDCRLAISSFWVL